MPTILENGVEVWNATPHDLYFCTEDGEGVVVAPPDEVINAQPYHQDVLRTEQYQLISMSFKPLPEGREIIQRVKRTHPNILIIGSIVAAQAYPGEVLAPVPCKASRKLTTRVSRLVRMDRFTTFAKNKKEEN